MTDFSTGVIASTTLPAGQRTYYEALLLETIRTKSIMVPFCSVKEDFRAKDTGIITYSEVFDAEPNWNEVAETDYWLKGSQLDSRTVSIALAIYGGVMKLSDFAELKNYWNNGDMRGLIRGKLGQMIVDEMDILARNAFLSAGPETDYSGSATTKATLLAGDIFDPDICEDIYTELEEADCPGVMDPADGGGATVVCVTTPRVIHDIRNGNDTWLDVQNYAGTGRKFTNEAGAWAGVRFVKSNRLKLWNAGVVIQQTTLSEASTAGEGAKNTIQTVYSVGQQSLNDDFINVTEENGFAVGDIVTIHAVGLGAAVLPTDGTQETRKIAELNHGAGNRMSFDKPLLKPHASGDYVTLARNVHASLFMGGPSVVLGVAERPNVMVLPKIDDLQMVQRFSWRAFLKFQMFRPEFLRVVYSAGSD
jgi:N4-gp56 family major capsid protein